MDVFTFSTEQKAAYRAEHAPSATDAQWEFFIMECERRRLVPGVHVAFKIKMVDEWSKALQNWAKVPKVVLITTVNALRLIAERGGKFEGYGATKYYYLEGSETIEKNIPVNSALYGVSVEGYRQGWRNPVFFFARYAAYVQNKDDGQPTSMWANRGPEQTAKCAEAGMLRMVAPEECGGLYLAEEFDKDTPAVQEQTAAAPLPEARVAPAVNQSAGTTERIETTVFDPKTIPPVDPGLKAALARVAEATPEALIAATSPAPAAPKRPVAPPKAPAAVKVPAPAQSLPVQPSPVPVQAPNPPQVTGGTTEANGAATPVTEQQPTSQPKPAPAPPAPPTAKPAPVEGEDAPFSKEEYTKFLEGRCAKLVRDRLDKAAPGKGGNLLRDYLHKVTGKKLQHIGAKTYESLISALEAMTPEAAIEFLKERAK